MGSIDNGDAGRRYQSYTADRAGFVVAGLYQSSERGAS